MSDLQAMVADNLARVADQVGEAAARAGRDPDEVTLIAVSKAQDPEKLAAAAAAGHLDFGENYVQEFRTKTERFAERGLRWHFIGRLQTNKVKYLIGNVHAVHSVDRLKLGREIAKRSRAAGFTTRALAQVNVGGELSKGGFELDEAEDAIGELVGLDGLAVDGLMAVPPFLEPDEVRPYFAQLRELRDHLARSLDRPLPMLSMGMSGDFEAAIAEGATHVRVGTAIFGARAYARR
jgi:PLP dependent protein